MKVALGITGSIAGYKALELIRLLRRNGNDVRVILTQSALNFVTPLSCQTLSDNEVYTDQFALTRGIKHISLNEWADILVIAPATANIIGKAANGIGDDLLSTTIISFQKPILFVPAMDSGMWENRIVQDNIKRLIENGKYVLEPGTGPLASGKIGKGRFPDVSRIYKKILICAGNYKSLKSKKILITGGRTEEDIDSVRVITNRASGMMALELYEAAICRDGDVRLIMGQAGLTVPEESNIFRVRTAMEMLLMLKKHIEWADILIMNAAVGDYKPVKESATKLHTETLTLKLRKNVDILKSIRDYKKNRLFIGFSVEDSNMLKRAQQKLKEKGLDYIVANPVSVIGKSTTSASIISSDGKLMEPGPMTKWELANYILDLAVK
ncbi:MAG: bifunctional phosphopantothenoylcysteine decarboxylase/phosphopantothenate--cysteine ligase CoaBC [candidate division WOR-3 bacterium]|nr:bifunctional phosphopantothenoylcysteine decarboxylase/phosphopantothenate--cysteine ligase CoaBC [candidate division WOR-3 bacterium]